MLQAAMTCREPTRPDELTAKRFMRLCLPEVQVCLHDDGSQQGMHDLDLRWPDGHIEAMEVTTDTAPERRRLGNRIDRQGAVVATEATRDWFVWLQAGTTNVRHIRAEIDHHLSLVEQEGLTRFAKHDRHSSDAVANVRRALGVDVATSREAAHEPPRINLLPPMHWWWEKPEAVNQAVERHAPANAEKLARSGRAARHLLVLIEPISVEAWGALISGKVPDDPPQLPEAITTAWAAGYRADGGPVVWRVRRTGHWEVLLL
jgi:hypothetical protein